MKSEIRTSLMYTPRVKPSLGPGSSLTPSHTLVNEINHLFQCPETYLLQFSILNQLHDGSFQFFVAVRSRLLTDLLNIKSSGEGLICSQGNKCKYQVKVHPLTGRWQTFCKGSGGKYFRLGRSYDLCCNY